jgi:hypothetical protein
MKFAPINKRLCPRNDMKIVMGGDANVKIGRKTIHHPKIGKYSLHETKNKLQMWVDKW